MCSKTTQKMEEKIVVKWKYSPPNFIDNGIRERDGYKFIIKDGVIEGEIMITVYHKSLRDELHQELDMIFKTDMINNQALYNLEKPSSVDHYYSDGRKDVDVYVEPLNIKFDSPPGRVDVVQVDENGYIIYDSKKERIEYQELCVKHQDDLLLKEIDDEDRNKAFTNA